MAILIFAVRATRESSALPPCSELQFRIDGGRTIHLVSQTAGRIGTVPEMWRKRVADTMHHRIPVHAYLWATSEIGAEVRAAVLVVTEGSSLENAHRNKTLMDEVDRLMAPPSPPAPQDGAWAGADMGQFPAGAPPGNAGYRASVVGESHYQQAIARTAVGEPAFLIPEPTNRYDARAISVLNANGEKIGYLARESWLHSVMLDEGWPVAATVDFIGTADGGLAGVVLGVEIGSTNEPAPTPAPLRIHLVKVIALIAALLALWLWLGKKPCKAVPAAACGNGWQGPTANDGAQNVPQHLSHADHPVSSSH